MHTTASKRVAQRVARIMFVAMLVFLSWGKLSNPLNYSAREFFLSAEVAYPMTIPGLIVEGLVIETVLGEPSRSWVHPAVGIVTASFVWAVVAYAIAALVATACSLISSKRAAKPES